MADGKGFGIRNYSARYSVNKTAQTVFEEKAFLYTLAHAGLLVPSTTICLIFSLQDHNEQRGPGQPFWLCVAHVDFDFLGISALQTH